VTGPFLSGNPTLRNEIAQISGTASVLAKLASGPSSGC
jgi:hypothetical protein